MDHKRLDKRLAHPLLVGLVGGILGILPDGDHLLYWAWPLAFALFGAGGRPLHIPLLLGGMYSWCSCLARYARLGLDVEVLDPDRKKRAMAILEKIAGVIVVIWTAIVSILAGGIIALLWELRWLFFLIGTIPR